MVLLRCMADETSSHLACVGAAIIILIHGFETFSQQMVTLQERPKLSQNTTSPPAPPPPRSETWGKDSIVAKGFGDLQLSTKAAVYDGIMAARVSELIPSCETSNCTWPIFPSLAVCGECTASLITQNCDLQNGCTFTTSPNASVTIPGGDIEESHFTVAPADNPRNFSIVYFSSFDILSVTKSSANTDVFAYSCALWVCLNSYNVTVTNGQHNSTIVGTWSKAEMSPETSAHFDEYMFVDIPPEMNANNATRFTVTQDALGVLQGFMNSKTWGNATNIAGNADYSSDWVQAMQNASSADINAWMSRLTLSMTNDIRQSGAVDEGRMFDYVGSAYIVAEYVHVEWFWVIYPVSLMFLAFGYLAQTVWETARDEVSAWKGDCLPMLFANIDKNIQKIVGRRMDVPGGLDERVGRTEIELVRKQDGSWLFKVPQRYVSSRSQ